MKVAIMQPYIFPYIGYYQLVACADKFVIYDDVNYIKRGYINRNYILDHGKKRRFTIPVPGASIHKKISELKFSSDVEAQLKGIQHAYSKAPCYDDVFPIIKKVFEGRDRDISEVCCDGIKSVFDYLGVNVSMCSSSQIDYDRELCGSEKLMNICDSLGARDYVNSVGGEKLYDKHYFSSRGYNLSFLRTNDFGYSQAGVSCFISNLSMIDTLMRCSKDEVGEILHKYDLV
ncbi:WbqC family protein [Litchfieldella rifensis]|uniref:WbqC family protein n=1 Tax=Litchfieldella rifensis TaxID=762643 RepID=A0ABV7LTF5_9GAMM